MKKLLLIAFIFSVGVAWAQDTIIKRSGDTLVVNITKSSSDFVEFTFPNETLINLEYKNNILEIIYISGRIEKCGAKTKLATINGIEDWEKVIITTNPDDVRGLTKVGEVVGKSGWGGTMAQGIGNKQAREKLKKAAAKKNAPIVLLQEKADEMGVKLVGVAYK